MAQLHNELLDIVTISKLGADLQGKSVQCVARLASIDAHADSAVLEDRGSKLTVDTSFLKGAVVAELLYATVLVIGQMDSDETTGTTRLRAYIIRSAEGTDTRELSQFLQARSSFLSRFASGGPAAGLASTSSFAQAGAGAAVGDQLAAINRLATSSSGSGGAAAGAGVPNDSMPMQEG